MKGLYESSPVSSTTTLELQESALRHLWFPFTRPGHRETERDPIILTHGEGVWLQDREGNRYLDGMGALEAMAIGHGRTRLADVAAEQMRQLAFLDVFRYASEPAIELAAELARIAPSGLDRIHFTPGGSEAVEVAIKLALQYHALRGEPQRRRVVTRQGAFHGVTFGAMNADGDYYATRNDVYLGDSRFGVVATGPASGPGWGLAARHTAGAAEFARTIEQLGPETVAAVIVDPLAVASAVAVPPVDDLRELRCMCDEHGILLIVDEVITGFGRSGQMFATQRAEVVPDLMPVSKALSSGYQPIGATLVRDVVTDVFAGDARPESVFTHGHTFGAHPVACAVALENLRIIQEEELAPRAEQIGGYVRQQLKPLMEHSGVIDVRGVGMITGVEISDDDRYWGGFGSAVGAARWLRTHLRDLGLITLTIHPGTVFLLAPPLILSEGEATTLAEIFDRGIRDAEAER